MRFEPQGVYLFPADNFGNQLQRLFIQFRSGAGVDDVQYTVAARNLIQDCSVQRERIITAVLVIVAEGAFAPTAACALKQYKFAGHVGVYSCISVHDANGFNGLMGNFTGCLSG